MAIGTRKLYYYDSGWQDISSYVTEISPIKYSVDNRVQGASTVLKIKLHTDASYGTNKYKLEIGSNHILYKAFPDGIENLGGYQVGITLVDYFFYLLSGKAPKNVSGAREANALGYGQYTIDARTDLFVPYSTGAGSFGPENFTSRDDTHYMDPMGNQITVDRSPRYITRGVMVRKDGTNYYGNVHVDIEDIVNDIAADENVTLNYSDIIGTKSSSSGTVTDLESDLKQIWDCKKMEGSNNFIVYLYSYYDSNTDIAEIRMRSHFASDGSTADTLTLGETQDWDEGGSQNHNLVYQMFIDRYNAKIYVPSWRSTQFAVNVASPFLLRMNKIDINMITGALTLDYQDDYSQSDLFERVADKTESEWETYDINTSKRWVEPPLMAYLFNWYCDSTMQRLVVGRENDSSHFSSGTTGNEVYVIDPDLHQSGGLDWKYKYDTTYTFVRDGIIGDCGQALDRVNGFIVAITYDSSNSEYHREYCKTAMSSLTANYSSYSLGDRSYANDHPSGIWGNAFMPDDSNSTPQRFNADQLPTGVLMRSSSTPHYPKIHNLYIGGENSHWNFTVEVAYPHCKPSFSYKDNMVFAWEPDASPGPTQVDWESFTNYEYRRIYLYQPFAYEDRKQQFIDAFVSFGYFYEQRDGNVRLLRFNGSGTNLGTFTDSDLLNKRNLSGNTDFANEWTIRILSQKLSYGSGTKQKEIKTFMGEYNWINKMLTDKYTDWNTKMDYDTSAIEIEANMEEFSSVTGTYLPYLGDQFTYNSINYNIFSVTIEVKNWIIKVRGVKDA